MSDKAPHDLRTTTPGRPAHGGVRPAELRALGLRPEEVLDFSASISPIGPPAGVREALQQVDLAAYPDPQCLVLREAICRRFFESAPGRAQAEDISIENILVGNGSTEIIHLLARAYLSPPRPDTENLAFLFAPTYGEYSSAARLAGAVTRSVQSTGHPPFRWDLEQAVREIHRLRPSLVFLCNPNNPTGVFLDRQDVSNIAESTSRVGGLLVIDEAYLSFAEDAWDSPALWPGGNVALLRSMTKDYGLTALRLGYVLASREVTSRLALYQPDWSVNGLAQAAGIAALADAEYLPRARRAVAEAKEYLAARLTRTGFTVPPSSANFLLVQVGDGASWRSKLMKLGLCVRDCASFGLPEYIRVGIRSLPDCQRLADAVNELA